MLPYSFQDFWQIPGPSPFKAEVKEQHRIHGFGPTITKISSLIWAFKLAGVGWGLFFK